MMQCMKACIKVMDKITETPDENDLLTLTSLHQVALSSQASHVKLNTISRLTVLSQILCIRF